jgi:diguanylate cyclase (GGDEF)-like protein
MTGLPNRQFFQECFEGVLVNARIEGCVVGLLTIRLEGMEQVRETLGRAAGDELIREIAVRLRQTVRMSDVVSRQDHDPAETDVAHFGGDEFSVLLNRIANPGDAAVAAQRVLTKVTAPILVDGHDMVLRASVGIGVYPQDGGDADTLLRNSTAAMSEAMNSGGNVYHFYAEAMNIANARKLNIQTRLRHAIRGNELELYFQPIAESKYGRITGAETLLRWVDSEIGPVPPKEFISIAEGCGLITEIGQWVLVAACAQVRAWQEAGFGDIRVSVNVSAKQLSEPDWASNVVETLRASGVSPGCIELEITETTIISDDAATIGALTELSGMGISIALDDFGTGYSSLAHLRQLPINRVKIDRSFVWEITKNASGASLCAAIVALAHCMQLEVVGEGVENHEQANFLRDCGCEELQGYMISRAVSAAEFERFLTRQKPE